MAPRKPSMFPSMPPWIPAKPLAAIPSSAPRRASTSPSTTPKKLARKSPTSSSICNSLYSARSFASFASRRFVSGRPVLFPLGCAVVGAGLAPPSRSPRRRFPSRLIERECQEEQLLVPLDLQRHRRSRSQRLQRAPQTIERRHRLSIQRTNDISGVQRHFNARACRPRRHEDSKGAPQVRRYGRDFLVNLNADNPQCRHKIFLRIGKRRDLIHIVWRFHDFHIESEALFSTQEINVDSVTSLHRQKMKRHERQIVHCSSVDTSQYVSDLHSCGFRRAARLHVGNHDPVLAR